MFRISSYTYDLYLSNHSFTSTKKDRCEIFFYKAPLEEISNLRPKDWKLKYKQRYKRVRYQYSETKEDGYDVELCLQSHLLTQTEPPFFISLPVMAAVSKSPRRSSTTMSNTALSLCIRTAQITQYLSRFNAMVCEMRLPKPV